MLRLDTHMSYSLLNARKRCQSMSVLYAQRRTISLRTSAHEFARPTDSDSSSVSWGVRIFSLHGGNK